MSVRVEGADELARQLEALARVTEAELAGIVGADSEAVARAASRAAPKDKGWLAEDVEVIEHSAPGQVEHDVGVTSRRRAKAAISQELGTEHHRPQPFLRPSLRRIAAKRGIARRLRERIEREL